VLHKSATPIPVEDIGAPDIQALIADMKATLAAAEDGVGLAAPQVGQSVRLFLVSAEAEAIDRRGAESSDERDAKRDWHHYVFINPRFTKRSRQKRELAEGCLSVPGMVGVVPRSEKVFIEWWDEYGQRHARGYSKFFARVLQHEMDHLDGMLILDRARDLVRPSAHDAHG